LETYSFHEGVLPSLIPLAFELSLFNRPENILLQRLDGWSTYYVLNKSKNTIEAVIHFYIADAIAKSPLKNPFGSLEFSESLTSEIIIEFWNFIETSLRLKGVKQIVIQNAPKIYGDVDVLHKVYLNSNFKVTAELMSSVIEIVDENTRNIFHRVERRCLKKCKDAGLIFKDVGIHELDTIYNFIHGCRDKKKFKLSMTLQDLKNVVEKFKDRYLLFAVYSDDQLVAASISIRVRENILYDFYHDHRKDFDHLSPVVMLVEGISKFCYKNKIFLLDLGTSAVNGQQIQTLLDFKIHLGATLSPKFTFEKILN
jgi:hypothetical protein